MSFQASSFEKMLQSELFDSFVSLLWLLHLLLCVIAILCSSFGIIWFFFLLQSSSSFITSYSFVCSVIILQILAFTQLIVTTNMAGLTFSAITVNLVFGMEESLEMCPTDACSFIRVKNYTV